MVELKEGRALGDGTSAVFASLVFSSAPTLLSHLFGSKTLALDYITKASQEVDGQYSSFRHCLAYSENELIGCITLWDNALPSSFHAHTLKSLKDFLSPNQIAHLIETNDEITQVFLAPQDYQLCIGHVGVLETFQGNGVGKKMIDHAMLKAKLRNKAELVLDVESGNAHAIRFYTHLGFEQKGASYYSGTEQTFYRMSYVL
jgi:ribosomal protein S18 acetylase RimI-like enzyme